MKLLLLCAVMLVSVVTAVPVAAQYYPYQQGLGNQPACCVTGPAYGRPGEPLGPAYNSGLFMPHPSTCGPGACQNNPYY
jgi:hypothetical protein